MVNGLNAIFSSVLEKKSVKKVKKDKDKKKDKNKRKKERKRKKKKEGRDKKEKKKKRRIEEEQEEPPLAQEAERASVLHQPSCNIHGGAASRHRDRGLEIVTIDQGQSDR